MHCKHFLSLLLLAVNLTLSAQIGPTLNVPASPPSAETVDCNPAQLLSPLPSESFAIESGVFPRFSWRIPETETKPSYTLEVYDADKRLIYEKQTTQTTLEADERLQATLQDAGRADFLWRVVTSDRECAPAASEFRSFVPAEQSRRGDCDYVFTNRFFIECQDPAYDANGNIRYKGYLTVRNNSTTDGLLTNHPNGVLGQHIDVDVPGASLNLVNCSSIGYGFPPAAVLVTGYAPGQMVTYCFELTVPFGTPNVTFLSQVITRSGTNDEGICNASKAVTLPPCVCDVCEKGYFMYSNKGEHIIARNYLPTDGSSIFQVAVDFILPTSHPIREINAEVISVQHEISDPQCHTCTKKHSRMGLIFDNGNNRIFGTSPWASNLGTLTNAIHNPLSVSTQYANEIKWIAQDLLQGVDMSTNNTRIIIQLAMPQLSSLSCCHSRFKVCVRYTFTDINCIPCDEVVCYEIDTSQNNFGSGVGTGLGTSQSGDPLNN